MAREKALNPWSDLATVVAGLIGNFRDEHERRHVRLSAYERSGGFDAADLRFRIGSATGGERIGFDVLRRKCVYIARCDQAGADVRARLETTAIHSVVCSAR